MKATIKTAFLTFALMCSMGMSASGTDNNTVKKRIQYGPSLMSATCSSDDAAPVLKAKSVKANVGVIANEGYIINAVIAVSVGTEKARFYEGQKSGSSYVIQAEKGVYDIMAYIASENSDEEIFLFKENVDLSSTKSIMLTQREATISTEISQKAPGGGDIILPSAGNRGNCSVADYMLMIRHSQYGTLLQSESVSFKNSCKRISVNLVPSRMSFTRMDEYSWEFGPIFVVNPIDFGKAVNGPDKDGWENVATSFAKTPMSDSWNKTQDMPYFAMTGYFVSIDNGCNAYVGMGNSDLSLPTNILFYWYPKGYDGYYKFYPMLRDNLIQMANASVTSMPYIMTEEGLLPCGLNLFDNGNAMLENGKFPKKGHPRFMKPLPQRAILGNAVPALMCLPSSSKSTAWDNGFTYGFKGRHGEEYGLDSYNFTDLMTAKQLEDIGGYRRTVSVKCDGNEICSSPGDFSNWMNWGNGETYQFDVSMWNVIIDKEIEGKVTGSMTYNASDGFIPTVTSLQFRDENDNVTDHLVASDNSNIEFTAATFKFVPGERRESYEYKAPSSVVVEYAPHGSSDFKPLVAEELAEYFFLPGYGNYYRVSLADIPLTETTWYDLRVTVNGEGEARQVQTLTPAFKAEKATGIHSMSCDADNNTYTVYSTDGKMVGEGENTLSRLKPGFYILKNGASVRKIHID